MSKHKSPGHRRTAKASRAARAVHDAVTLPVADSTSDSTAAFRTPLARLLDAPLLAQLVPRLAPETLHQLIQQSGLGACGELVAAATPEQMASILDLDLWRHAQPGRDEQFDADRFGDWLELLMDIGEPGAARIVAALDARLVIAGLIRYVRVFDPPAMASPVATDDELIDLDMRPRDGSECAVGGYLVCAIRADAWDAIVALLIGLEADHRPYFDVVMRGCRTLSNSAPEVDGLDDLLLAPDQLLRDVALDREHRRSQQGYSTPADARAFLQMARQPRGQRPAGPVTMNPIATAYFRASDEAVAASGDLDATRPAPRALAPAPTGESLANAVDAMVDVLAEAGLVPQRPRALLEGERPEQSRVTLIRRLMESVRDIDDTAYLTRSRELAFLVNTLMAGCSIQSRPFTAQEASDAVVGVCNVGLEHWPARWPEPETGDVRSTARGASILPDAFLVDHDLVMAFEVGWAVLHDDVGMFVAKQLIVTLATLRSVDAEIRADLVLLRRALIEHREAGTPWRARPALEVIAMLDPLSWASLVGLLDECPVLPAALTATLERRTGAVSPTAFEFISTAAQIDQVRAFMARLPDALRG